MRSLAFADRVATLREERPQRVEVWRAGQHFLDRLEIGDAIDTGVAACGGYQFEVAVRRDRRQMLVTHDLSDADNTKTDRLFHSRYVPKG